MPCPAQGVRFCWINKTVPLLENQRHVLRGLAIVGPSCIHQRNAREAARRAHLDAFGANRGAPWRDPTNGG